MTIKTRITKLEKLTRPRGTRHYFVYYDGQSTQALEDFKARYPKGIVFRVCYDTRAPIQNQAALS